MDTVRKTLRVIVASLLIAALSGIAALYIVTDPTTEIAAFGDFDPAPLERLSEKYELYDKDGAVMCTVGSDGRRLASFENVGKYTADAFLAIEDARFYEHGAVDPLRIAGAALTNIASMEAKEGASTITQQLVKNAYLSPEKTIMRKVREIRLARAVEQRYTKDEILEMYLNSVYFGNNIYGIENAAYRYFGKPAAALELGESAMLAAVINNPGRYDPYLNKENAEMRKRLVLRRMREENLITNEEYESALPETPLSSPGTSPCIFVQYAVREAVAPGRVDTAFDPAIQHIAESVLAASVTNDYTAAVMILDVRSGRPVAAAANEYRNFPELKRRPGSTIKPLICYAPALDAGIITPVTPLLDEPTSFGSYNPGNYNDRYYGWTTATECLARSLNIPAVKLMNMYGIERAKSYGKRLGLKFSAGDNGLALALGGMEYGVDLGALCGAYARIAGGGCGVVTKESAYLLTKMLEQCARSGTAKALSSLQNVAAKTGTVGSEYGNTDAYCIAYNGRYVVGVWCGAESSVLPEGITGGGVPAEVCADIMKCPALRGEAFERPKTVVCVDIDAAELELRHRVTAAGSSTLPKDRISAEFSIYNMPGRARGNEDLLPGDYENFKVVDGFVDQ